MAGTSKNRRAEHLHRSYPSLAQSYPAREPVLHARLQYDEIAADPDFGPLGQNLSRPRSNPAAITAFLSLQCVLPVH